MFKVLSLNGNVSCGNLAVHAVIKGGFTQEQINAKKSLIARGVQFMDDECTVNLADSCVNGEELSLRMRCLRNDGNQLVYLLFEKMGETEFGIERMDQRITDKQIREQKNVIDNIISRFTGKYDDKLADIKVNISMVHEYRLLKGIRCIDSERLPMNQIVEGLKDWLLSHANDSRIGIMELRGKDYLVILCPKNYKKGIKVGGIFQEIFYEIAPKNNFSAFKGELMRRKLLVCDVNDACMDIQKTISAKKCRELDTKYGKVICFDFEPEFVNMIKLARVEADEVIDIDNKEIENTFAEGDYFRRLYDGGEEDVYSILG